MSIRNAAKAFIIKDNKILLNKCINTTGFAMDGIFANEVYYDLPGGGQKQYETLEEAIKRECAEETGYNVAVDRLVALYEEIYMDIEARKQYPDYTHKVYFIFTCHLLDEEIRTITEKDIDQVESEWIDIKDIANIKLQPEIIKNNLQVILSTENPIFLGSKRIKQENQSIDEMFSYNVKKDNKVFIYWYDKNIKIISGEKARKFLAQIEGADSVEAQQLMAKVTGNLKRKKDGDINTIVIRGTHYTRNKNNC